MENYIVSARKYRPETFQTVIGQPSITTTLKNAIRIKQLAHAYLFCGPRGVGKTTCARIFAKTINCSDMSEGIEACNKCESCLAFNASRSYNIHELDAASNNSVDDIRNLIDQVRIPPQVGKYSVYIIDEVHMLSANAFNAFLKTLEEPPSHAIFILATTEKHKIIPTILSRCQIFDFNRIKIEDIVVHLENIARTENIEAETEGLNIIAQKADGAMRDALSIFDQIAGFSAGKISYQNVIDNLNVLDYDYYFRITDSILAGDFSSALMIFDEILNKGFDGHNFINGLSSHFRDLLVCRDEITLGLLEVGTSIRERYKLQSKSCSPDFLISSLAITNQCDISFRTSKNQRLHVELCLVQLCGQTTGEKKNPEPDAIRLKKGVSGTTEESGQTPRMGDERLKKSALTNRGDAEDKPQTLPLPEGAGKEPQNISKVESPQEPPADQVKPEPEPLNASGQPGADDAAKEPQNAPGPAGQQQEQAPAASAAKPPPDTKNPTAQHNGLKSAEPGQGNSGNTFSIRDALKGIAPAQPGGPEEKADTEDGGETLDVSQDSEEFTEKDLIEQWRKFANQIRDNYPRLHNTLLANKPEISSPGKIRFEISNPLQEEALNKIRPELLSHLKRELNSSLELEICINDTLKESRLYLPEDKYEHMLKKNPELAKFRQKFNLDFE